MAKAHVDLAEGQRLDLELLKAKLEGRTTALKVKLESMEQRENAAKEALASSESASTSARTEISSLQQQVKDTASLAKRAVNETNCRLTLQRKHGSMLRISELELTTPWAPSVTKALLIRTRTTMPATLTSSLTL